MHIREIKVICGEIINKETAQPTICAAALNPPDTVCLKLLLKSWISEVNLEATVVYFDYVYKNVSQIVI